ncbi:NAD(P)-binding protein [Tricholoma matsutake]|nr:NAD(P)-binding protein [Tricholoma matsutake 945]
MSKGLILVTGVTGFIAGHVVDQLLTAGYRVRGTARGAKAKKLTETIKRPGLEFSQVDDLIDGDLTEALKGVSAIIHVASPTPGRASVQHTLDSAKEGTLHILREALKAGIERVVVTTTIGTFLAPDFGPAFTGQTFTSKDWSHASEEEAKEPGRSPFYVYLSSKYLAERALWEFVKAHPQLDVVTILPSYVFGPYAETYPRPITKENLGTNEVVYGIMKGPQIQAIPFVVHVHDAAKAHVLALDLPRNPGALERRYIVNGGNITWREAIDHLKITHPELNTPPSSEYPDIPGPPSVIDASDTITDLKFGKFIDVKQTIDDAVVALQEVEGSWS